jgi:hemerythrin-like domain-containing protein
MTTDAAVLLSDLRRDHRNIAIVLGILDQEVNNLVHTETPDFELAHDVMQYMIVYSDAVHHPKEDVLYAKMRVEIPAIATGLERVETDHREIAVLGENLRRNIEAIISGTAVTRIRLATDSTDYIQRLRDHMAWEEEDLFCRADELVRNRGSLPLELTHLGSGDPIFGSDRERSFARLLQHILEAQS